MRALSEQLSDLSVRAKKTENVVAATRTKDRERLERRRAKLTSAIAEGKAKAEEQAAAAKGAAAAWWTDARSSMDQRFAEMRAAADERRTERDVKQAERHADAAAEDAAEAIDVALYFLDQAEYAAIDAVLARADADDLVMAS
jgi:hypothetical protein